MARTKQFEPDLALDRAMDLFWRQGYEATSVQDLVDHLAVSRSSLYDTFGGKEQLFQQALANYCRREAGPRHELLSGPGSALDALRALLVGLARAPEAHPDRRGCMVVNAAMERIPADARTTAAVGAQLARFEEALYAVVRRGQQAGEVASERDPRSLARFLVTVVQGMRVVEKASADPELLLDAAEVALGAVFGEQAFGATGDSSLQTRR